MQTRMRNHMHAHLSMYGCLSPCPADIGSADISTHFNAVFEFLAEAERLKQGELLQTPTPYTVLVINKAAVLMIALSTAPHDTPLTYHNGTVLSPVTTVQGLICACPMYTMSSVLIQPTQMLYVLSHAGPLAP
jgi:hypothetical protein